MHGREPVHRRRRHLITPTTRAALPGITRRTVLEIAAEEGIDDRGARRLADGAALRRRGVRVRLRRGRRADRLLRRAPGRAAAPPADRADPGRLPRAGRVPPRTGPSSTLACHEVLGHGAGALRAARAAPHTPTDGRVSTFAERDALIHGIAGDERYVFVTEPGDRGRTRRRRASSCSTATPAAGGRGAARPARRLQAAVHAARPAHRAPRRPRQRRLPAAVARRSSTTTTTGPSTASSGPSSRARRTSPAMPLGFAEDVEVLPNGEYVVSESVVGGLWLIGRDGKIRRGLVPDDGAPAAAEPRPVPVPQRRHRHGRRTCRSRPGRELRSRRRLARGPRQRAVPQLDLRGRHPAPRDQDAARHPQAGRRARRRRSIVVTPRKNDLESLKGITFNRWDAKDPYIYAGDPFRLHADPRRLAHGQARGASPSDARRFNFTSRRRSCRRSAHGQAEPARDRERPGVPLERDQRRAQRPTCSSRRSSSPSTTRSGQDADATSWTGSRRTRAPARPRVRSEPAPQVRRGRRPPAARADGLPRLSPDPPIDRG